MSVHHRIAKSSILLLLASSIAGFVGACVSQTPGSNSIISQTTDLEQQRVTAQLKDKLGSGTASEFVPAIIRLNQLRGLRVMGGVIPADDKRQLRSAVISQLQEHALKTQEDILDALSELETVGLVRNVQPLWVANVISADLTAEAVDSLLRNPGIEYITADTEAPLFLNKPTWNVRKVNSPAVWVRPSGAYTGKGVVVAVLDSGADLDHPDLVNRFWINGAEDLNGDGRLTRADYNGRDDDANGFVDDVVGWDFESGDNDPSPNLFESGRGRGHGTHVAGIIAGDGTNGVSTGIAPGASLMILKISSQSSVWAAVQYALANGADIINMSMGWTNSLSPDLSTWRDVIDNAVDAGALMVTGAGSGGQAPLTHAPAPDDITTPGRVPRALTIGAVAPPTRLAWVDPIAPFSSGGPTSWQSVEQFHDYPFPPGLLKPDMTAPGVEITSTMIGGAYQAKSGTSMATAHVSGVAALLLEQNPDLLPHEMIFILRETAWRFVDPNNVRGWGRLDALKAINYEHEPSVFDLTVRMPNDLWATESVWIDNDGDARPDQPVAGMTNRVYARVRNNGGQPVGNVDIRFYYTDAGTIGSQAFGPAIPDNAALRYIGSYSAPVIGPAGSSQDTVVGAVDWIVPDSDNDTNYWSLGVDVVAPNPPNKEEANRSNNVAFNSHFNITVSPGEIFTFRFFIHGDSRSPHEPFDLEVLRNGLSPYFDVELSLDEMSADKWVERMRGFEPVIPVEVAEFPADVAEYVSKSMKLLGDRGHLERIALTDGQPVAARLVLRAPDLDSRYFERARSQSQFLVVSTANKNEILGGLALNISINPDTTQIKTLIYTEK